MGARIIAAALWFLLPVSVPSWAQQPKASSSNEALPTVAAAAVPFYPPLARVARVYGTVEVLVTVGETWGQTGRSPVFLGDETNIHLPCVAG